MMALDATDEVTEGQGFAGNFEKDFNDACHRHGCKPFDLLKIRYPLPPLPIAITPRPSSAIVPQDTQPMGEAETPIETERSISAAQMPEITQDGVVVTVEERENTPSASENTDQKPPGPRVMSYMSRYRYAPTMVLETLEEDEELQKLEIRGWKMPQGILEALSSVVPACPTITNIVFWNCGLASSHIPPLLTLLNNAPIRSLSLDQNPLIAQELFADLISQESTLRQLSLRSNKIGNTGAKCLADQLRANRALIALNLWDNDIGREGAEALAEALKLNQTLTSLSLGLNLIGDEGAIAFAKVLSNYALPHDELASRRKALADLDKQKKEQEEDAVSKKSKNRNAAASGTGAGGARNNSAKIQSQESVLSTSGTLKKETAADLKSKRSTKGATTKATDPPPSSGGKASPGLANTNKQKSSSEVAQTPPATAAKKGTVAATKESAGAVEEKGGARGSKDKKAVPLAKGGKKQKTEEAKEETDEVLESAPPAIEPMFEYNGQWFILGNRTLNNLNLFRNDIREDGLQALLEAVQDQEATAEHATEGSIGLYRLTLLENAFDTDNTYYEQLISVLNSRNPYYDGPEQSIEDPEKIELASDEGASA